ncbi:MAG: hypothetical protein IPM35_13650 [Myxococcales bacterium]|nr:hypothetical protein [Myxococcales bacterium]
MQRFFSYLGLVTLASACVPTDDQPQSSSAPANAPQAQPAPQPQPAPAPPPPVAQPQGSGRLDPNRPMASANPFVLGDAAPKPGTRSVSAREQRRLVSPALRDKGRDPAHLAQPAAAPPEPPPPPVLEQPSVAAQPAAAAAAPKPPAAAPDSPITGVYWDTFERGELGAEWNPTSPEWRIIGGRLCGSKARNHPVWLKRKLPTNARIEFDAVSTSADGDLKVEIWGDGKGFAKGVSYNDATSYLAIYGGWKNQFHVLARLDEHAPGRPEVKVSAGGDYKARPVVPNTVYHFKVERSDGKTVRWFVDDIEIIAFTDPAPLRGDGHEHLGFNDWEVQVCFDNLVISALPGG